MASIFSKIIYGEIPCYKVAEDQNHIAFLDINPNAKGHTLCVPKKEVNKLFDLNAQAYSELMEFSRTVALGLRKAVPCQRIGMTVIGLEVPHVHVHLIPLNSMSDATFTKKEEVSERHRHRFEFNNFYRQQMEENGLIISGTNPERNLVEIVEVENHPWYVGVQFHPEFQSKPNKAHPLFAAFIEASLNHKLANVQSGNGSPK